MINFNTDIKVSGDLTFSGTLIGNIPILVSTETGNVLVQTSTGLFVQKVDKGPAGDQGPAGAKGDKGDTGDTGTVGLRGNDGHLFGLGNGSTAFPNMLGSTDFTGNRFLALNASESPVPGNPVVGISLQASETNSSQFFMANNNGSVKLRMRSVLKTNGLLQSSSWITVYTDQEKPPQTSVDLSSLVPVSRTINRRNFRNDITLTPDDLGVYKNTVMDQKYYKVLESFGDVKLNSLTLLNSTVPNISMSNGILTLAASSGVSIHETLNVNSLSSTGNIKEQNVRVYSPNNLPSSNTKVTSVISSPVSPVVLDASTAQAYSITLSSSTAVQLNVTNTSSTNNGSLMEMFITLNHVVANSTVTFSSNVTFNDSEFKLKTTAGVRDFISLISYDQGITWYGYVIGVGSKNTGSDSNSIDVGNGVIVVSVDGEPAPNIPVTSVTLTPSTFNIAIGKTQQLTATVLPSTATNKAVTFKSSNTAIATVSSTGLVTAVATGTATITVTTVDGAFTKTSACTVAATNVAVTGITLTPSTFTATVGDTTQLTYTITPSNATNKAVTFKSSNTAMATVSSTGLVTSLAAGSPVITVTTSDGSFSKTSTATISAGSGMVTGNMKTSGTKIVDKNGNTVKLKSVNWFGAESSTNIPHGIWQRSYKDIIDQMASFGFNCVRIPFSGDTFRSGKAPVGGVDTSVADNADFILSGDPTKPATVVFKDTFTCMDYIVNYLASKNMYVVFDHHRRSAGSGADGSPIDGSYSLSNWLATWTSVASHYKSFPNVIGADVHNEPHDLDWNTWAGYAEQAGNAVLASAPNWLVMVEGVGSYNNEGYWWGGMLKGVATRPVVLNTPNKVVYSPHEYGQSVGGQSWLSSDSNQVPGYPGNLPAVFKNAWGFIIENNIAPLWIGEFGGHFGTKPDGTSAPNKVPEEQWLDQLIKYINQYGINYAYWCYNPNSGDTGGLVMSDWTTPATYKLTLLQPLLSVN